MTNPTTEALADLRAYQDRRGNVALIGSFETVFEVMFGPRQHDAHVIAYRAHSRAESFKEAGERFAGWFAADMAERREKAAQELAECNGYDTAILRARHHRYAHGGMSREKFAPAQARIALRALDIAIEWHDAKYLAAAE